MEESRDHSEPNAETRPVKEAVSETRFVEGADGGEAPVKILISARSVTKDMVARADAALVHIEKGMLRQGLRLSKWPFPPEVRKDECTSLNLDEQQVDSTGGKSSGQKLPSLSQMSEDELLQPRVDALFHILKKLNLQKYREEFQKALERRLVGQPAQRRRFRKKASPAAEIDAVTNKIVKKIKTMKLKYDSYELAEMAFLALMRNDKSTKPMLDLINIYNAESASIPASFYSFRKGMEILAKRSWINYVLDKTETTSHGYINDGNDMKRTLSRVCQTLSKKIRKPTEDLFEFSAIGHAMRRMGEEFASRRQRIHAVLAFYTAAKLYKLKHIGFASLFDVTACLQGVYLIVGQMRHQKTVVVAHVIPFMKKIRKFLSSTDGDQHFFHEYDAKCWSYIGYCCFIVREYKDSLAGFESAIRIMEVKFGGRENTYEAYGGRLAYAGFSYFKLGSFQEAAKQFNLALKAYETAEDWESEEVKNLSIQSVRRYLKVIEGKGETSISTASVK